MYFVKNFQVLLSFSKLDSNKRNFILFPWTVRSYSILVNNRYYFFYKKNVLNVYIFQHFQHF